jgi:hypothetical protein
MYLRPLYLPPVGALREQPSELVEAGRRRPQEPVRVVIHQRDRAQYFSK